jgi:RNA polymerase sigma factor (sigma-70 family)
MHAEADEPSAELLARFRDGEEDAAAELFGRYVERLTALARSRLSPRLAVRADAEDIVLSAYRSFFVGARNGRFSLTRGGDLWRLLVSITLHKLYRQAKHHSADLRAISAERPLGQNDAEFPPAVDREPTPDEAVALQDELEWVMAQLGPFERRVLELRLQGEQLAEIAVETGRSERTVRRALATIRELMQVRLGNADDA